MLKIPQMLDQYGNTERGAIQCHSVLSLDFVFTLLLECQGNEVQKQNYHAESYKCTLALILYCTYIVKNTGTKSHISNKLYQIIMLLALYEITLFLSAPICFFPGSLNL